MCSWAAIAQAYYMKYKDPNQPISVRIKDLMSQMTLEEKIGQMTQIERKVASTEVMKNYYIGKTPLLFSSLFRKYICATIFNDTCMYFRY